jgi:RimJ/RimL family protein N-acetyltransferase
MPDVHPDTGQPLGFRVDVQPALSPQAVTLSGRYGSVERLEAARHRAALWDAVAGHPHIWTYMRDGPFADAAVFSDWLVSREQARDAFYYAVVDAEGRALGLASLMRIEPDMRVIEVGNILLSPLLQRTPLATEAQYLLALYVFDALRYRRYEWKCDALNAASRRAALRLGFSFEGIFRDHMIIKGRSRDTAWFAMLKTEWPARKAAFERWLAAENFDANGAQKKKLGEFHSLEKIR